MQLVSTRIDSNLVLYSAPNVPAIDAEMKDAPHALEAACTCVHDAAMEEVPGKK